MKILEREDRQDFVMTLGDSKNMQSFVMPDEAFYYVLLQRTAYQKSLNRYFRCVHLGGFYDKYLLKRIELSRKNEISQLYTKDMHFEFNTFKKFLPQNVKMILDIGCGIGGIDVLMYRHYCSLEPVLSLLDKEGISGKIYYGYSGTGAFYNSLAVAEEFLTANTVPTTKIATYDVDTAGFPKGKVFDVILSLISWGFHYPVEVYLDEAFDALSDNGVLILDVRKDTDGKDILSRKFSSVEVILNGEKHERVLVKK